MKSVISVEEMRKIESLTMKSLRITDIELLSEAGKKLSEDFLLRVNPLHHHQIVAIAGVGHNGADALVMALDLLKQTFRVKVIVVGQVEQASFAFKYFFNHVQSMTKVIFYRQDQLIEVEKALHGAHVLIDGLFGIGLKRPVDGHYLSMIQTINQYTKIVYAIDLPSGIHPESGLAYPEAVKADFTGVIGSYKYGNIFNDALDYHGKMSVIDIGLVKRVETDCLYLEDDDMSIKPGKRKHRSHKYDYGLGYYIGGSQSMSGAINLSVLAAMRSGIGIACVYQEHPETRHLEVMYKDIHDPIDYEKADVVVFGPGLQRDKALYQSIYQSLNASRVKTIIDGGGISYIDPLTVKNPNMVVTPHLKEFSELVNQPIDRVRENVIPLVKEFVKSGITLVLKGETTVIANHKHIYLYQAKNPGLATAGSGDVLSGMISAYMNTESPLIASVKGVMLHSQAALYARVSKGETSMMARDIIDHIYLVLK